MRHFAHRRTGWTIATLVFLIGAPGSRTAHAAGGLWVQLGGDGAELSHKLPADGDSRIHRLDNDREQVAAARHLIQSQGRYGQVSVEHWTGQNPN